MLPHRTKRGQCCVFFFGANNYGWILKSNLQCFSSQVPFMKKGKSKSIVYKQGLEIAMGMHATEREEIDMGVPFHETMYVFIIYMQKIT